MAKKPIDPNPPAAASNAGESDPNLAATPGAGEGSDAGQPASGEGEPPPVAAPPPVEQQTAATTLDPAPKLRVNLTGSVTGSAEIEAGQTLHDALTAISVAAPQQYQFRDGAGRPVALDRKLTESVAITAVPKTRQG